MKHRRTGEFFPNASRGRVEDVASGARGLLARWRCLDRSASSGRLESEKTLPLRDAVHDHYQGSIVKEATSVDEMMTVLREEDREHLKPCRTVPAVVSSLRVTALPRALDDSTSRKPTQRL